MKKTTKNEPTTPRSKADHAVEASRTATTEAKRLGDELSAARARAQAELAPGRTVDLAVEADLLDLEASALEAEDIAAHQRTIASLACDAADEAEGDEFAIACGLDTMHRDFSELEAERADLQTKLEAVEARKRARVDEASHARSKLAAQRLASGLPAPAPLPRVTADPTGPRTMLEAIERRRALGATPLNQRADRINMLRDRALTLRADLERKRIEDEKRAADLAEAEAFDEHERKADEARKAKEHAEWIARGQAAIAETERLAGEQRRRATT